MTRHTHIVLIAVIAFVFTTLASCSKDPEPLIQAPPFVPVDTIRPNPNPGTGGGNTGGINDSSGVTVMRGTGGSALYYNWGDRGQLATFLSQDGYASTVHLYFDSAAPVRIKLVNAGLGIMTVRPRVTSGNYTHVEIDFSNVNYYTKAEQVDHPDTAGKLQIWTYRADGKDIIPANGSKPAVKTIIQVPGSFPSDPDIGGLIRLLDYDFPGYPVRPPSVDLTVLQQIFAASRWKVHKFIWPL